MLNFAAKDSMPMASNPVHIFSQTLPSALAHSPEPLPHAHAAHNHTDHVLRPKEICAGLHALHHVSPYNNDDNNNIIRNEKCLIAVLKI